MTANTMHGDGEGGQGTIGERWAGVDERWLGGGPRAGGRWTGGRLLALLLLGATGVSAIRLGQELFLGASPSTGAAVAGFVQNFLAACAWIVVGTGVVWLARRVPLGRERWLRAAAVHFTGIGAAGLAVNVLAGAGWVAAGVRPGDVGFAELVAEQTVAHLHANALLYVLIAVLASARFADPRRREQNAGPSPEAVEDAAAPDGGGGSRTPLERIPVPRGGRTLLIDVDRIDWIEADGDYVSLHVDGRDHLLSETMGGLEGRLDPGRFARAHRSAIVNLARVREVRPEPAGNATLVLDDGTRVPLARRRRAEVEERLGL